jgi:hypothetical protein
VAALVGLPAMFAWSAFWLTTTVPSIVWGPISFALVLCMGTLVPLLPVAALAWVEPDAPAGD